MSRKFGTFEGVFIPAIEAILGTVLFILMPPLVARVGLIPMIFIILLAHSVTIATAFSIADCATNLNTIGAGGMYALIRRSLGTTFGGSIGVQFYLAQTASIAFYAAGFAEPLQPILSGLDIFSPFASMSILAQKQLIATGIYILFFAVVFVGADFTIKVQKGILVILAMAFISILISPTLNITTSLAGESSSVFTSSFNLFGKSINFRILTIAFTMFFPAVTGIGAGVGMSGDLKDARRSMVKGTFLAIICGLIVYILVAIVFSKINSTLLLKNPLSDNFISNFSLVQLLGISDFTPMAILVFIGILVATASSGLSYFMSAPRTAYAMTFDEILPKWMSALGADIFRGGKEPRVATIATAMLGFVVIYSGGIETAALVVGIAFLAVYGWLNFSAFLERISRNPSFRPASKGHWLISLYGFTMCMLMISLFNPLVGIIIFAIQIGIFSLIYKYRSNAKIGGVWWGFVFFWSTSLLRILSKMAPDKKNWRPIMRVIAFGDKGPENIISLGSMIAEYQGLVSVNILCEANSNLCLISEESPEISIKNVTIGKNSDITEGILLLLQASNYSRLETNSILIEYNTRIDWERFIEEVILAKKHLLVYKDGLITRWTNIFVIDVWWRGDDNGYLSALISYIITISNSTKRIRTRIRIIRKLGKNENYEEAKTELVLLLGKARLGGEVLIIENEGKKIIDSIKEISGKSNLIMIGLPKHETREGHNIFSHKDSFNRQISIFEGLPPVLFVKAAYRMELIEE